MSNVCFCRRVHFRAAHHYARPDLDEAGNRERFGAGALPHFHDWTLTIWLQGALNEDGMIVDLMQVDAALDEVVVQPFHEQHINLVDPFFKTRQPTNEVLAGYFAQKLMPFFPYNKLVRLRIAEDDDLFAEWTP